MERDEYVSLSVEYFKGKMSIADLAIEIERKVALHVDRIDLLADERVMLIANHPKAHPELSIPAELIAGLKGGNSRNFPDFWFPIVRQMMLKKAMGRRFFTIGYDIGWKTAMQEMGHFLIRHEGNGRCQEIISRLGKADCSVAIFPEGGARNMETFRSGFFYIACELGIRKLAVCKFSSELTLNGPNSLRLIKLEDIGCIADSVKEFIDFQRRSIVAA